jgi:hypothetical protein
MDAWANHGFCPNRVPTERVAWDDATTAWASDAVGRTAAFAILV